MGWARTNIWDKSIIYSLDMEYYRNIPEPFEDYGYRECDFFCPDCIIIRDIIK